jgi:hypothetical protein
MLTSFAKLTKSRASSGVRSEALEIATAEMASSTETSGSEASAKTVSVSSSERSAEVNVAASVRLISLS